MRKIFFLLFLFVTLLTSAQQDTGKISPDSQPIQSIADSVVQSTEIRSYQESNVRNLLQLTQELDKRRAREKRNAYIRIGFGVLLLVILVVGLMRRKKK